MESTLELNDFSPPSAPSLGQQRDALQKGLGRAAQWATSGVLASEPLLDACLHDMRFDQQCEDNRGEWLWRLISITDNTSEFREPLLTALRNVNEAHDAYQLCDLAMHFARSGDEAFRNLLYEFVGRRQIPDSPSIGEGQLLSLDGEDAFLFLARLRGQSLLTRVWGWDDGAVIDAAIEEYGEARVREILTHSTEPEIFGFANGWLENQKSPVDRDAWRQEKDEKIAAATVSDVILAAETEPNCFWLRTWGKQASANDLEMVLERLFSEHDPTVIINLLHLFALRPFDRFDDRLIELCKHSDRKVQRRTFNVLCENSFPEIRALALAEIQKNSLGFPPIGLLIKNYQPGDEQLVLDQVELPEDPGDRHWMLIDLCNLLKENETADSSKLGQLAYFHNPCQMCRCSAAELLFSQGCVPAWLAEECRFDAEEETRSLVDEPREKSPD